MALLNRTMNDAPRYGQVQGVTEDNNPTKGQSLRLIQDGTSNDTFNQEAYYLYFIAVLGILLNILVVIFLFIRRSMRKLTSAFLIHACFLDGLKSAYCIPIAYNLISQKKPSDCDFFGATYVLIVTASIFNLVAMVCTEAYTFGEENIGGNSHGSLCCIVFGIILVYIASTILHLGPTLIGGYFEFHPQIGSCSFVLGKQTGYVANVMWISIVTLAVFGVIHFICKLYKEIQMNHPNRVSMLVRSSITICDNPRTAACNIRSMIKDSSHRAKMFILNIIAFIVCWYPLFFVIVIDRDFKVSPKVYQAFSFIAWTQGTIQPILYICFDRQIDLLAKYVYCDHYRQQSLNAFADWLTRQQATANQEVAISEDICHSHRNRQRPYNLDQSDHTEIDDGMSAHSSRGTYRSFKQSHEDSPESNAASNSSAMCQGNVSDIGNAPTLQVSNPHSQCNTVNPITGYEGSLKAHMMKTAKPEMEVD
ncbi:hypothetical protein FSP39_024658 [Pinctada imbricata]|uniref:G-protein coupled receptors family 1 profile domain-containing protein n=1 Tax=Pinctada imbricata TaxID=66713 RepID=A0AA88XGX8_PINIB|nr:hypothetical protein FSP39_024658 [Pinctada imbricata]